MRFDWQGFCSRYRVPFVTRGPNTARGHISIKCPYCGSADSSEHMGLKLDERDPRWGCFRNARHRGRHPRRLVQKLLGCSFEEAVLIVGAQAVPTADEGELEQAMKRLTDDEEISPRGSNSHKSVNFPQEVRPLERSRYGNAFLDYLEKERGFPYEALPDVIQRYGLRYALTGDFEWRLVFPIFDVSGSLVGLTGREIRPLAKLRYRTTESLPNDAIFNVQHAAHEGAETLIIVEGPLDTAKVDFFGRDLDVACVGTLGTALPPERRAALALLACQFDRVALLFDDDTLPEVLSLAPEISETAGLDVELWRPKGKDPGAMWWGHLIEFLEEHLDKGSK